MTESEIIRRIEKFTLKDDLSTYDPYDVWKTTIGFFIKKEYYKSKIALIPAGILTLIDHYINNKVRFFYKKQEYPIVRAQASLTLINLYQKSGNKKNIEYAKIHIDWLLQNYSKNYNGYCWGLNFRWVYSANDVYNETIPFSTHTPYPLEAMVKYYQIIKDERLIEPIRSVFLFLENDIKVMKETDEILIMSYGVEKDRIVANSNSYIMYMYSLLIDFIPERSDYIKTKINKIYHFLVSVQNNDGSWLYAPYDENSFIDCFHSCFILKNIFKTNANFKLTGANNTINHGYLFIKNSFYCEKKGLYKRFTKQNKPSIVRFDLYDNAEMLSLAILLLDEEVVIKLNIQIQSIFCNKNDIYSVVDVFGIKKNKNTLRWAVLPYLLAISSK